MSSKKATSSKNDDYGNEDSGESTPPDQEDAQTETDTYTTKTKVIQVVTAVPKVLNEEEDLSKVGLLIDIEESEAKIGTRKHNNLPQEAPKIEKPNRSYDPFENEQVIFLIPPEKESEKVTPKKANVVEPPPASVIPHYTAEPNNMIPPLETKKPPKVLINNPPPCPPPDLTEICTSLKPDIIIGEIDKDEATIIYENLLGLGKRVVDWLGTEINNLNACNQSSPRQSCKRPQAAHAFQKQIVSIETEYNRLKRNIKSDNGAQSNWLPQPVYYDPEELIKPEDIQPKIFSSNNKRIENNKLRMTFDMKDDDVPCSSNSTQRPNVPVFCQCKCRDYKVVKTCPFCVEDRLKNLETAVKNHDGSFTNVVAELRACLEYCNTSYFANDGQDELRARIAALFKIVELHKAALEDWKKEFQKKYKSQH